MNPEQVILGQIIPADSDDSEPAEPQETFLHKVASAPFSPSGSGMADRNVSTTALDDGAVYDGTVDDDTEVISATGFAEAGSSAEADGPEACPPAPPAETDAYTADADMSMADEAAVDEAAVDKADAAEADAAEADAAVADSTGIADTVTDTPAVRTPSGQAPDSDEPLLGEVAGRIREEWRQVQASFVDDPRTSLAAAAGVVADAAARLESLLRERQRSLRGSWDGNGQGDTETLRQLMLVYRRLLTKLIS